MSQDEEYSYYGDLPEVGGPAADSGRAPARGEPSASAAAALGEGLGEMRSEIRELRAQLQEVLNQKGNLDQLQAHLSKLAEIVNGLSEAQQGQEEEQEPPRPMDWAQVPAAERPSWMQERARWVREVLLTNYPDAAARLRPCWPLHTTLLNDMSLLEWIYQDGFGDKRRLLSAESFRRTLETMLERAERLTHTCPQPDSDQMHPVPVPPRDDSAQVDLMRQQLALQEAFEYYLQAGTVQEDLRAKGEQATQEEHRLADEQVRELGESMRRIIIEAGVDGQGWETFKEQAKLQLQQQQKAAQSRGGAST